MVNFFFHVSVTPTICIAAVLVCAMLDGWHGLLPWVQERQPAGFPSKWHAYVLTGITDDKPLAQLWAFHGCIEGEERTQRFHFAVEEKLDIEALEADVDKEFLETYPETLRDRSQIKAKLQHVGQLTRESKQKVWIPNRAHVKRIVDKEQKIMRPDSNMPTPLQISTIDAMFSHTEP